MDDFLTDQLAILGLNERDVRVFTALATFGRMNMTKLAARAGLPRTTVDYIVRGLIKQKLVSREKVLGHFEYAVPLGKVADRLDTLEQKLQPQSMAAHTDEKIVKPTSLDVHALIAGAYAAHEGDRATLLLAALPDDKARLVALEHYFGYARKNNTKLEILTSKNVVDGLSGYAKEILALLSCFELRVNVLPTSFCIEGIDLTLFRNEVLVIDHFHERLERITGSLGVQVMRHLLLVARETAWSIDIRLLLEHYVEGNAKT